jgi:SAM-dependent methyltransferase
MAKTPDTCLICGFTRFSLVCVWKSMQILRCSSCGVLCTHPLPSEAELLRLYEEGELLHELNMDEVVEKIEFPHWKLKEHRQILRMLADIGVSQGRLLDIGCLWGSFLDSARQSGFEVAGIEPYERAAQYARNVLKLNVLSGSLKNVALPNSSFDAITILDVIEHLCDPVEELRTALGLLKPNGVLAVVTPNVEGLPVRVLGLKRRIFGQPWCPIDDLPWHLWGFTPRTIAGALDRAGYRVEFVQGLSPSMFTTNASAGSGPWKRLGLAALGSISRLVGKSDRLVAYARRVARA